MKSKKFKITLLIIMVTLSSCNKWLDIEPKGKILLTSAQDYGLLFDNITSYDNTDIAYLDDEGWRNASNIASVWNTWNLTAANMLYLPNTVYDRSFNATGNSGTSGTTFYQSIYQRISKISNTIIYDKDKMTGSETEIKSVVAEAKMLRAFSYFMLINVYAKPYDKATAANDGGVPLKLDPFIETLPVPAKSTVEEVYAQIEKDITEALPDLYATAKTPYRFNKAAAYAFKAKVHLFKKEFDECIEAALESNRLNGKTFNLVSLVNPVTNKPTTPLYASGDENLFFAATSSASTYIGQELINLLKAGLQNYGEGTNVTDARLDLYKRPAATINDYMFILSWVPSAKEYSPNVVGLTTTEVMLMLAECYARKGQNEKVKEYLKPYLESRYRNYIHANFTLPSDITNTVKFVINERRKELTRGVNRFFDLRRLNTETAYQKVPARLFPADPVATPSIPQQTYTLPVNSPLYILPFPSKVIENDKRLTSNTW
ncbi:RagB/SusD family nutrient uptake outer membrane protein [Pedobacter sp.]|jgi:hypothetical protein|uniref:RagB/SusD family nutrient uptake outer membrane protein n=1 Tax=Pedobacter sp. TaxID=1411316 RepID=UPI002BA69272|nr:RagB/SusD family nutrient uptake outer membrane protein [Pedobacter sp.]HWW41557.1 RagB/SusD family nutrient uptake outer membrane protein [Pedobacter sp.]